MVQKMNDVNQQNRFSTFPVQCGCLSFSSSFSASFPSLFYDEKYKVKQSITQSKQWSFSVPVCIYYVILSHDSVAGGHTSEMLKLMMSMDLEFYYPRCYIVAASDRHSTEKAKEFEMTRTGHTKSVTSHFCHT